MAEDVLFLPFTPLSFQMLTNVGDVNNIWQEDSRADTRGYSAILDIMRSVSYEKSQEHMLSLVEENGAP